jgi:hypothetical protein
VCGITALQYFGGVRAVLARCFTLPYGSELGRIQTQMTQKPMLRAEVNACALLASKNMTSALSYLFVRTLPCGSWSKFGPFAGPCVVRCLVRTSARVPRGVRAESKPHATYGAPHLFYSPQLIRWLIGVVTATTAGAIKDSISFRCGSFWCGAWPL